VRWKKNAKSFIIFNYPNRCRFYRIRNSKIEASSFLVGYIWAMKVGTKIEVEGEEDLQFDYDDIVKSFEGRLRLILIQLIILEGLSVQMI
jgi:1-acyl-sn-glycerol-3-phosphate acyltransferase